MPAMQSVIKKGYIIFVICIATLFGVAFSLTPILQQDSVATWNVVRYILGVLLFLLSFIVLLYLNQRVTTTEEKQTNKISDRRLFVILFVTMTIIGSIYLIIYWPGTGLYDTVYIINTDHWGVARQHPWFYCLIISKIVDAVFAMGGGYDIAVPLLSLIQILISAAVYSYGLVWLHRKGINNIIWGIIALVYVFSPIYNMYMITILKDVPYSLLLFIWVPVLYDIWETDGELLRTKKVFLQICVFLFLSLLRNNGVYVSIFILFGLLLCYKKFWRQIIIFVAVLFLVVLGSNWFEKEHDITHLFKETVGIPLQQIAATVYYDGEITDEQEQFINKVIPVEFIKEKYNPYSADTLKWGNSPLDNDFLNENKIQFLKVWAQMLVPNFRIYVEAYLKNTYSFWSVTSSDQNQIYTTFYVESFKEWYDEENVVIKKILPENLQIRLENITTMLAKSPESGKLFWICILLLVVLGYIYGIKIISIGLPLIGGWITVMISTPVAYQWRYTLYMAMALPLIVGILFIKSRFKYESMVDNS